VKFLETKLANGLKIIGEQRSGAKSVALGFFVRAGARDETPEVSGVSHFLEHMMFKGTAKRDALKVTYDLGAMGAQANAYTTEENTVYYLSVLPEYFENALELYSDMLRPSLDQKEFDTEKKVILEEIALYKDRPTFVLFERALAEHFRNHDAGNSVLGSNESITALTSQQMRTYFDSRYTASNIVLAVSGNFNWDKLVELAEKYCGQWPGNVVERKLTPNIVKPNSITVHREKLNCAHCCMVTNAPSATDPRRYAAEVLSTIIGDSSGSRAYWELTDKGLADSASVDTDEMDGTGIVYGYVSCDPKNIEKVSGILKNIMSTALDFSDKDLERAKTKLATRFVLQGESVMKRLMAIGLNWTYGNGYLSLEKELNAIKEVTREDIVELTKEFDFTPVTVVTMLPSE
jgi:predicted Zn-dependent peptidase